MRQGLWKCPRCGFYWVWRTSDQVLKLDRVCRKDDHRIQINLDRKRGNRGRPRPTSILEYPSYRPMDGIIAEARSRNRKVSGIKRAEDRKLGYEDGFVKATVISDNLERLTTKSAGDPTKHDDELRDLV
jgi:hypothetical protein